MLRNVTPLEKQCQKKFFPPKFNVPQQKAILYKLQHQ